MALGVNLEIGGIKISLDKPGVSPVKIHDFSAAYDSFLCGEKHNGKEPDLTIRVLGEDAPPLDRGRRVFDSGQSWIMYRDGPGYWLAFHPRTFEKPLWTARFRYPPKEVTVYCNQPLNPLGYPLDQLLLMYTLAARSGALVHCAGMAAAGKGFIFAGPSGAGKTTISRLLSGREDVELLSDDRMIARERDGGFLAYGTPWPGEAGIAVNKGLPLAGLFFLEQAKENKIEALAPGEAFEKLLPVTSVPWYDRDVMPRVLGLCEKLAACVPAYTLHFTPDETSATHVTQFIEGD